MCGGNRKRSFASLRMTRRGGSDRTCSAAFTPWGSHPSKPGFPNLRKPGFDLGLFLMISDYCCPALFLTLSLFHFAYETVIDLDFLSSVSVFVFYGFVDYDLVDKVVKHRRGELRCVGVFTDQIDP